MLGKKGGISKAHTLKEQGIANAESFAEATTATAAKFDWICHC